MISMKHNTPLMPVTIHMLSGCITFFVLLARADARSAGVVQVMRS